MTGNETKLYQTGKDPAEEYDLVRDATYGKRLVDMRKQLLRLRREDLLGLEEPARPQQLTDEEREKLRSLGYVE